MNGRRMYEEARALRRAKRLHLLSRATVVPREPGKVLQFPNKKEVTGGANLCSGEDSDLG